MEDLHICKAEISGLDRLSHERITQEISKLLDFPNPVQALQTAHSVGVLDIVLGEPDLNGLENLLELENRVRLESRWIRRLGLIDRDPENARLMLIREEARYLRDMKTFQKSDSPLATHCYQLGFEVSRDAMLIRKARDGDFDIESEIEELEHGKVTRFPLSASIIHDNTHNHKEMNFRMKQAKQAWLESGLRLDRSELLEVYSKDP